jgi:hypothetical protein
MQLKAQSTLSDLVRDGQPLPAALNRLGLFDFPRLFAELDPPQKETLRGVFKGSFVGPGWLRRLAGPLLAVTGLGGWWGKDFDPKGNAVNLVLRRGQMQRRFPMLLDEEVSRLDQRPGLSLRYASQNPIPWPWIVDELRSLQPGKLLGMSMLRPPALKWLALPFVLQAQASPIPPTPFPREGGD